MKRKVVVLILSSLIGVSSVLAVEQKQPVELSQEEKVKVKVSKKEAILAAKKYLKGVVELGELIDAKLCRIPPTYYWADEVTVLSKKKHGDKVEKIGKKRWVLIGKPRKLQPAWVLTFKKKESFTGKGKVWICIDPYTKELLGGTETN
jgi:hypothetical protein